MNTIAVSDSVIDSCTLIYVEVDQNSNKVWQGTVLTSGVFIAEWGRIGTKLQSKTYQFSSLGLAQNKFERIKRQKLRKGYTTAPILTKNSSNKVNLKPQDLDTIAAKQIQHGKDPRAKQLIRYLVEVNIHDITSQTNISYNSYTGNFSTPLGLVTPEAISQARDYLLQIATAPKKNNPSIRNLINNYLRLIPQKLNHKIDYQIFYSQGEIQRQYEILNALSAAIDINSTNDQHNIFECSIKRVPGSTLAGRKIFREIRQLYKSTINQNHLSANYKLRRLYEVNIPSMTQTFTKKAASIGNIKTHWHGTKASNLLSIFQGGLIIPPANAVQCTGRMFGNGIYGSEQSTKALNYATNYWNNSGDNAQRVFMLLCDFAMGKEYHPTSRSGGFPIKGYDSTYVKPGTMNVINQESIVYSTDQVKIKYLCEFL
ncbi:MAG: WGR domain-containing protein [Xenococcaceae cyanobacterium MO_188.B19]|nr:WGR domain-containing protein [Xenococcaceae cyanobacterium MO_188.B19]